jgi:hypothetical protein
VRSHYLLATDDALIAQCEVDRYRASGPGGQHRNKTESAVRRLRAAIALAVREPITDISPRLSAMIAGGTAPLGAKTRQTGEFWAAIAELLDRLVANNLEIATTAQQLGMTTGALSKLLLHDDHVARTVNDLRRARNMRPLR